MILAPPFAVLDLNVDRLVQFVVNMLAVGGAFLLGQFITGLGVWLLDRRLTRGRVPVGFKRAARSCGGVALAVFAALVLFGHGVGWTVMGGGVAGDENAAPTAADAGDGGQASLPVAPNDVPPRQVIHTATPATERVRVTLLGGDDVRDERFYLIDDDPAAKTFAELRELLSRRLTNGARPGLVIAFSPLNTLPANHPAALRLTHWAHANGMPVTIDAGSP